jgi:flagellar biogenesis protein FliO
MVPLRFAAGVIPVNAIRILVALVVISTYTWKSEARGSDDSGQQVAPQVAEQPDIEGAAADQAEPTNRFASRFGQTSNEARSTFTARDYGLSDFDAGRLVGRTVLVTTSFAAVCAVLLLVIRHVRQQGGLKGSTREMNVLETLTLGPRCVLQLVQVERQRFLVARDAHGVRSVTPVQSFVETLDDISLPDAEPVARQPLNSASTFGLSLEGPAAAEWSTRELNGRRTDPWQAL